MTTHNTAHDTPNSAAEAPVQAERRVPRWAVPLVAVAIAAAVWFAGSVAGVDIAARTGTEIKHIGMVDVVVAALVVSLLGWGVRALLGRLRNGGRKVWLVTCAALLVLSLFGVLGAVSAAAAVVLLAEHVAVGTVIALGLRR